jgi:hypothetical protein
MDATEADKSERYKEVVRLATCAIHTGNWTIALQALDKPIEKGISEAAQLRGELFDPRNPFGDRPVNAPQADLIKSFNCYRSNPNQALKECLIDWARSQKEKDEVAEDFIAVLDSSQHRNITTLPDRVSRMRSRLNKECKDTL